MSTTAVSGFAERCLLDRDINADPYPYLAAVREHSPVYWSRIHQSWLITGYREVIGCLQSGRISADRLSNVSDDEDVRRSFQVLAKWMAFNDSSEHRRLRSVFQEAFYRLQVQQYQPLAQRIVEQQLVQLREKGGHCDLVADFAQPVSFTFFSQFLGVSPADLDDFREWTARVGEFILGMLISAKGFRVSHQSVVKLFHHFQSLIKQRQTSPGDDLISTVLEKSLGDVSEEEFAAMLTHLSFAGAETTSNLITNGIRAILMNREQRKLLQDEPQHLDTAIDECLRFDGPLKLIIRMANSDLELGGQTIKAGTRLYLLTAAANRDPAQFDHPDVLDIRRTPNAHLGFGHGIHSCLGSSLGHMLSRETIGSLFHEYPNLALDGHAHEWRISIMGRSLKALPVRN
jgi:cytochrome P450